MIQRTNIRVLHQKLGHYPAVVLVGPRQCGKTTLAKSLPGIHYFDLEKEADQLRLDLEWGRLVATEQCVVLDEAQTCPKLFPRLRGAIDDDRKRNGRFLLLGSVSPALMRNIAESLAGRLAICEQTPFHATEMPCERWDDLWCLGGYPDGGVLEAARFPGWQMDYLSLLAQRDFPIWGLAAHPATTLRLLKMLAAVNGQQWNASQIGGSMGLSYHTINHYLEFLEQAFLIRRIPAWSGNNAKRLVKTPRVYWRDSGLCHALLGLQSPGALLDQPWVGNSWEGWVIEQVLTAFQLAGIHTDAYWARTHGQNEVDLFVTFGNERWAIEIKLTAHPKPDDFRGLRNMNELLKPTRRIVVSRTRDCVWNQEEASVNVKGLLDHISEFNWR